MSRTHELHHKDERVRGHIEHRGPDRWRIAIDLGTDATGKRRRISHTIHGSRKQAEAELARLLHEVTTESYVEPATMLMDEYLRQWLAHARTTVAPHTYRRYAQIVGSELIPAFGRTRLRDLSPLEIQAFLSRSLARNCHTDERQLSAQTVRHFFQVLRRALNQAVRWELIVRNPCQLVDPPRASSPEMKVLDEEGLQKLLSAAQGSRLHPVIFLAATTGMRRGELLALRWSDLDTQTGECRVCRSLEERETGLGYKSPKTRKGRRVVVLPQAALAQLRSHRAKQGKERLLLGAGYKDEDLIFARADGSPWPPTQFSSEFARLARKHGIRIRFHDLRHTHATHLLKAGVPVRVVSERLGHAAASITLDVYAHVLPGQQQEAAAKVDAMLGRMATGK